MNLYTLLLTCLFFVNVLTENCDKHGIRLYEDMACKPVFNGGPCPTSYNCILKASKSDQCMVRGKIYNQGDAILQDTTKHTCEFGCSCARRNNKTIVNCPAWGCGNWAGFPPVPNGCHREYKLDSCCSTGILCPPFKDTTTCTVDATEYKAGEKFFPKNSCTACLCQKGFNGKLEAPFCKRIGCDAQVKHQTEIQESCAAVYRNGNDCCPSSWTCPDGSEVINTNGKKSDSTCKYGDKILQIGDTFDKEIQGFSLKKLLKCECKIPPLVLCQEV